MSTRATQCPHCGRLHDSGLSTCPLTGKSMSAPPALVVPRPPSADSRKQRERRDLVGRTIDGKFKVRAVIGEGGMGSVFEAEQLTIRRLVAIKVLHPSQARKAVAVKRFHQEARAVGAIGHPNICEVYDMGSLEDGSPYLVLERLTGQTLSARIASEGRLRWSEAVDVMTQVASGLIAAHERGILHRDIKPENVFLSQRPGCPAIVKLLDFGVSKVLTTTPRSGDFDDETLTKTGMVMGTPYYMAPEQARGERDLDGRVDVYACGVVLYEILTGKRPFHGGNYNALLLAILTGTPAPLRSLEPTVPSSLERVVAMAMARSRHDRTPTAAALRDGLQSVVAAPPLNVVPRRSDSIDVPISFADSSEVDLQMLDEDNPTTTARSALGLPSMEEDAYADEARDHTTLMTPDEIARAVQTTPRQRSVHDTDQQETPPQHDEDSTRTVRRDVLIQPLPAKDKRGKH
jgi:eukaryotic-like serine/threonine-protein kinase